MKLVYCKLGLMLKGILILILCFVSFSAISKELNNNVRYLNDINLNTEISKYLSKSKSLNATDLKILVSGNSILGHTCNTKALYELYFKHNGDLLFRKNNSNQEVYLGKWWVKGNSIFSQWKTYHKKETVNELRYHHLLDEIYIPYNVNLACGPAGSFGRPFIVVKGNVFKL
ncbi:hypothetical protein [Shewanella surugensis]|uniref:Uncharacterized protein n=1 Tax=Shewanella surugensis TaxID=212020 RepID=A0ABT0LJD5_9GAMM|nr:hypothetical protein [Shewanella surugensis]MCL1127819.1 hypothetical protein [Shewanella surugensis]